MIKSHGRSAFNKEILLFANSFEEMLKFEADQITSVFDNPMCMNLAIGDPISGGVIKHSEKTKAKIRDSTLARIKKLSSEQRARMTEAAILNRSKDVCERISKALKGKPKSLESIEKMKITKSNQNTSEAVRLGWINRRQNLVK